MVRRGKYTVNAGPKRHTRKRKVLSGGGKTEPVEQPSNARRMRFGNQTKPSVPLFTNPLYSGESEGQVPLSNNPLYERGKTSSDSVPSHSKPMDSRWSWRKRNLVLNPLSTFKAIKHNYQLSKNNKNKEMEPSTQPFHNLEYPGSKYGMNFQNNLGHQGIKQGDGRTKLFIKRNKLTGEEQEVFRSANQSIFDYMGDNGMMSRNWRSNEDYEEVPDITAENANDPLPPVKSTTAYPTQPTNEQKHALAKRAREEARMFEMTKNLKPTARQGAQSPKQMAAMNAAMNAAGQARMRNLANGQTNYLAVLRAKKAAAAARAGVTFGPVGGESSTDPAAVLAASSRLGPRSGIGRGAFKSPPPPKSSSSSSLRPNPVVVASPKSNSKIWSFESRPSTGGMNQY
jgi:hypothetical protein